MVGLNFLLVMERTLVVFDVVGLLLCVIFYVVDMFVFYVGGFVYEESMEQ